MAVTFAALSKLKVQVGLLCKDSSGNAYRVVDTGEDHLKFVNATTTTNLKEHTLKSKSVQVPIVEIDMTDPQSVDMLLGQVSEECNGGYMLCPDADSTTGGWIAIWDLESYDGDLTLVPAVTVQGSPWGWRPLWSAGITPPTYQFADRAAAIEAMAVDLLQ